MKFVPVREVVLRDLARRVEGSTLAMRCAAKVLCMNPSAEDLRDVAHDIRCARWRGDGDDREALARCAERLAEAHPITAALELAHIDDSEAEGEGATAFVERHLRAWASEQGVEVYL